MGIISGGIRVEENKEIAEEILNMVEMSIRAHDLCLSYATHTLDGKIGVKVNIVDAERNQLDTFSNISRQPRCCGDLMRVYSFRTVSSPIFVYPDRVGPEVIDYLKNHYNIPENICLRFP